MIKTILIDDEVSGLETLRMAVEKYCPDISIEGSYQSPVEGLQAIRHDKPDLVFLDVQMPQLSGFDVLQQASSSPFEVIFVSAHDQYAIKAIRFSALDYLLKPIDVDELIQSVKRVKESLNKKNSLYRYQSVLNNIQLGSGRIERLAVPAADGIDFFNTADIIYCKADGSYTTLVMTNQQDVIVCKNLKDFENLLAHSGFCRVHHAHLINLRHVQKYIRGDGGYVILTGNHHVDISRRKKDEFLQLLDKP
ncbi:MAG TPA: LytTR family DNA-binding domain-containing protein [Ohtaekwangia sp.]|nr:LytTR family DNA-binding domain-containing protein [Ohtaekwangia sp.]